MLHFEDGITYGWLHKQGHSICLELNSEKYKQKQSDGWSQDRGETISDDMPDPLNELTDKEVRELAKAHDIKNYWNAKIENLKQKIKESL